jgi:tetratricopeptide (TPR) repeat protein
MGSSSGRFNKQGAKMGDLRSCVKSMACAAFMVAVSNMAIGATQANPTQSLESIVAAASEAQAKGNFSAAAEYYRQAVKMSPGTAGLWANLGLMDDLAGNSSDALKSFTEAAHLDGLMYVPQLFLGIENLKLNHAEAAIPFLLKAEQINPKDPQAPLALGRAFALSGKGDRASDAYRRVIDLSPDNGDAWLGLGMAELQQSGADDRTMTEAYKSSAYTRLRAGETFAEQGKLARASDVYASVLTSESRPPLCTHATYGLLLMRQQEISKAGAEFEQELKLGSGCSLATLGQAALLLKQGDTNGALNDLVTLWHADQGFLQENLPLLRDVLTDEQRDQLLHMAEDLKAHGDSLSPESGNGSKTAQGQNEAERFYVSGQYMKCTESLQPRLSVLSESSLSLLAPCAFYTGDYRTASLAARRLKSIPATHASGLYWESRANQKLAVTSLARAGETASNSPHLHVLLGDIYRQKLQWEDAESEYRKALVLEAHNQNASLGLAMALFGDGKNDEALAIDKTLLMETPDFPEENLLAGEILVRIGHYADAESYLKKVRDTGQKFMPHVHVLLGEIYFATDRFPQALSEFKSGPINDDDGSIHYQLGRTYQKLGDKEKAQEAFHISERLRQQSDDRTNPAIQ